MKISVIIPIYNMAEYIAYALESVLEQTLKDIEIICIDDGSTDDSYVILERYAAKYNNIIVLKQKNCGPGRARNLGISKAQGEFVCFLDADDFYLSKDVMQYLYEMAIKHSVNICGGSSCDYRNGVISVLGVRKERIFKNNGWVTKEDYPGFTGYWAFIFKREFLIKNDIFFPSYKRGEDPPFFMKAIGCAGGAYCLSKMVLAYRKEHKKVIYDLEKSLDAIRGCRDVLIIAKENGMYKVQREIINELMGEAGAFAYTYAYKGSMEMNFLIEECNKYIDENISEKEGDINGKVLLTGDELRKYVENNIKEKSLFIDKLKNTEYIYIFGAGTIGRKVASFVRKHNINVTSFIVSDSRQNPLEVDEIKVNEIDSIQAEKNYIVIIATFWFSQQEILKTLHENGIRNIYSIDLRQFFLWQDRVEH